MEVSNVEDALAWLAATWVEGLISLRNLCSFVANEVGFYIPRRCRTRAMGLAETGRWDATKRLYLE
jgi:hypothetical protein